MPSYTVVVTGANRGVGLAYTEALLKRGHAVVATARNPESATELQHLKTQYSGKLDVITLDISSKQSAEDAAAAVSELPIGKDGIDFLINNAGVLYGPSLNGLFGYPDAVTDLKKQMDVNVYGTIQVTAAFLPLLRKKANGKKVIVNVSTLSAALGIDLAKTSITSTYSISKTALNMVSTKMHGELAAEGFTVVPLSPGLVKTDMSSAVVDGFGENNPFAGFEALTPENAAEQAIKFILELTPDHSARFFSYNGNEEQW
ncbi:hypothetical protein OIV83_006332 [Microbotryomycetes sp. JL201]|nr:hypothetical protein OIV83_006332 [Microbotryomycetes sp. JL201]